ncbi:hypothetical protein IRP61_11215 (plasmid) [Clostridium botulinum]|nr:hypothetical protein [Clostridium botulinum]QPW56579.1 hypothetical protein IRP61_11215 [Clostridium botulinum]
MNIKRWTSSKSIKVDLDKLKSNGGVNMNKLKSFNLNILQNKKTTIVSTQDSLKDVTPINWSEEVLSGEKKVLLNYNDK